MDCMSEVSHRQAAALPGPKPMRGIAVHLGLALFPHRASSCDSLILASACVVGTRPLLSRTCKNICNLLESLNYNGKQTSLGGNCTTLR